MCNYLGSGADYVYYLVKRVSLAIIFSGINEFLAKFI